MLKQVALFSACLWLAACEPMKASYVMDRQRTSSVVRSVEFTVEYDGEGIMTVLSHAKSVKGTRRVKKSFAIAKEILTPEFAQMLRNRGEWTSQKGVKVHYLGPWGTCEKLKITHLPDTEQEFGIKVTAVVCPFDRTVPFVDIEFKTWWGIPVTIGLNLKP